MSRSGALVPASEAPAEALRMLEELARALRAEGVESAEAAVGPLAESVRRSALPGALWVGPKDEAVGIAVWEATGDVGRRTALYLSPAYRSDAAVISFLDALEAMPGALPLVELSDQLPGVTAAQRRAIFGARGFVAVPRLDLGWPVDRAPPEPLRPEGGQLRPLLPTDSTSLSRLLVAAYADNPTDVALFRRWKDPTLEARSSIEFLLSGDLGPWNAPASFGVEREGELGAATLVNELNGALISQVMSDPRYRRRGWATALLARTIGELRRQGTPSIRLVVTRENARAYRLYRRLGFEPVPGAEGVSWIHPVRLGLSAA
ncbi:MAG: GNAT family N-acetyltransferase [Thermoplasmata archaeon]|nr:GNAT family N-acetyltransferase [Thermoplasmata archaeon]